MNTSCVDTVKCRLDAGKSPIFRLQSPCTYIYVQESQWFWDFVRISGMSFCRGSVNCHGSDGQMYHFCESSRSGEILLDQYRGGGWGLAASG